MKSFRLGDRVETVDDVLKGRIVAITGEQITIETEDGFPMEFRANELLLIESNRHIDPSSSEIEIAKKQKGARSKNPSSPIIGKKRNSAFMEVDLHAEKLSYLPKNHSNYDLLEYQLREARNQLEYAIRKNIPRIIFIHGVGEGVLKAELYSIFRKYPGLQFYDANYREYGMGATEVLTRSGS